MRIVSGGELSRLMLAVKRVLSRSDLVSLYVFDEVDVGLGGRVARRIGVTSLPVCGGNTEVLRAHRLDAEGLAEAMAQQMAART